MIELFQYAENAALVKSHYYRKNPKTGAMIEVNDKRTKKAPDPKKGRPLRHAEELALEVGKKAPKQDVPKLRSERYEGKPPAKPKADPQPKPTAKAEQDAERPYADKNPELVRALKEANGAQNALRRLKPGTPAYEKAEARLVAAHAKVRSHTSGKPADEATSKALINPAEQRRQAEEKARNKTAPTPEEHRATIEETKGHMQGVMDHFQALLNNPKAAPFHQDAQKVMEVLARHKAMLEGHHLADPAAMHFQQLAAHESTGDDELDGLEFKRRHHEAVLANKSAAPLHEESRKALEETGKAIEARKKAIEAEKAAKDGAAAPASNDSQKPKPKPQAAKKPAAKPAATKPSKKPAAKPAPKKPQPAITVPTKADHEQASQAVQEVESKITPPAKPKRTPKPKAPAGPQEIGQGNTGKVYRDGDEVEKNATRPDGTATGEGEAYKDLEGVLGVAPGRQEGDKVRLPHYDKVLSVDTVKTPEERAKFGDALRKNFRRMVAAVNGLSTSGRHYGDPLQFGMDKEGTMHLLDLSNTTKDDQAHGVHLGNMGLLSSYLEQFGAPELAAKIGHAKEVLTGAQLAHMFKRKPNKMTEEEFKPLQEAMTHVGERPQNAYYADKPAKGKGYHSVPVADGGHVVISAKPLTPAQMRKHGALPIVHKGEPLKAADEPAPKPPAAPKAAPQTKAEKARAKAETYAVDQYSKYANKARKIGDRQKARQSKEDK